MEFIDEQLNILNKQYPEWKENGFGKAPICIPDAPDVCYHEDTMLTVDRNLHADYLTHELKTTTKKSGNHAEIRVHQMFQRSKVGGILIQQIESPSLGKLKAMFKLSAEEKKKLNFINSMIK